MRVSDERLLTCAHVAQDAGAAGPGDAVCVQFPALGVSYPAVVVPEGWAAAEGTAGDVAVLQLQGVPDAVRPVGVRALYSLDGLASSSCGFPVGYDDGMWVRATLGLGVGRAWVQMEVASHAAVEPGYSGAAVWSDAHTAVVAMMVTRDTKTAGRVAFAIPIRTVAGLFSALQLDPETATHWGPRSRGVSSDADGAGWLFSGRRRALSDLAGWLVSSDPPGLRVVTGVPGTGKSALLARLITTADRRYRTRIPDLADDDPAVVSADAIDVTFHAKGQTVSGFVEHVAAVLDVSLSQSTAAGLVDAAREARGRWVIAVDAIDESTEPRALCALLNALSAQSCRVLAACREHLLDALRDNSPLRLDQAPYLEPADIKTYVTRLLNDQQAVGDVSDGTLVAQIAEAAQGNFLVAQLLTNAIALGGAVLRPLPRDVASAFEALLDALPDPRTTRELLLALAYARGDGLPKELWRAAASALSRPYQRADIDELLRGPAASFLITRLDDPDGARHRLFHEALAETLTRSRDTIGDQALLWNTWTADVAAGARAGWERAPAYLLMYGAEHASAAGALPALVSDMSYLLYADLSRLLIQLADDDWPTQRRVPEVTALLRLAATRLQPLGPDERASAIALAACHLGLPALATEALSHAGTGWRARWAHRLGDPHQPLRGHTSWVTAVAIGAAGGREIIASASMDQTVRVWDAVSGQPLGDPLTGHTNRVTAVVVGAAGGREIIASASRDQTVRVWDAQTHDLVQIIDTLAPARALTLDQSGVLHVGAGIAICRFEPAVEHATRT